jgi:hypothetical protein
VILLDDVEKYKQGRRVEGYTGQSGWSLELEIDP